MIRTLYKTKLLPVGEEFVVDLFDMFLRRQYRIEFGAEAKHFRESGTFDAKGVDGGPIGGQLVGGGVTQILAQQLHRVESGLHDG